MRQKAKLRVENALPRLGADGRTPWEVVSDGASSTTLLRQITGEGVFVTDRAKVLLTHKNYEVGEPGRRMCFGLIRYGELHPGHIMHEANNAAMLRGYTLPQMEAVGLLAQEVKCQEIGGRLFIMHRAFSFSIASQPAVFFLEPDADNKRLALDAVSISSYLARSTDMYLFEIEP